MKHSRLIAALLPGRQNPGMKRPLRDSLKTGRTLAERYLCPICRSNRSAFEIIFKLSRDPQGPGDGRRAVQADSMSVMLRNDRPELEVMPQVRLHWL